jgi:hypothetical protein
VQLFDQDGVEIYSGTGDGQVSKNQTTTVNIRVNHNTGNLNIVVEVPGSNPSSAVLKGYWPLDGNGNDQSGEGNHGVVSGSVTFDTGVKGQAAYFGGIAGANVLIPNPERYNNMASFTLVAWICPQTYGDWNTFFIKHTPGRDFQFGLAANGALGYTFENGGYSHCVSDTIVPLNQWTHVTAIWTGTKQQIYINGVFAKEKDCTGTGPAWTGTTMLIGSLLENYTSFSGKVDETKIYSGMLTPEEIQADYAAGAALLNP